MKEESEQPNVEQASLTQVFATAVQFLTRIPVKGTMGGTAEFYNTALRRSVVFFPLVGGLVGVFTAAIFVIAMKVGLSPLVAALLALGLEATLTGAFHEDAFADTWDALGGGWTREQVLEIMKDSRLGTYGTIALVIGVGLRAATMATMGEHDGLHAAAAIIAAAAVGRIAILIMMAIATPIDDRASQAKDVSGTQTMQTVLWGALISLPLWLTWLVLDFKLAACGLIVSAVVLIWFRRKCLIRVGGTTGDLLGCSAFMIQLTILLVSCLN